jgi:hypothetical protein
LFLPIKFEWDIKKRRGRLAIPNVATMSAEPIRNPITDEEHQIRTVLPKAWMFYEAELDSGTAKGIGYIKFDFARRHCDFAYFAYDNNGMAFSYEEHKKRFGLDNQ